MEPQKRHVYAKKYYPSVIPEDPNLPIYESPDPQPLMPWRLGVEFTRIVDGLPVVFVIREDGVEGRLSDFLVQEDPRQQERSPGKPRFVDG
jgi:hypothetical protein